MTTKTVVALGSVGAFIVVMVLLVAYGGYRTSSDRLETYVSPAGSIVSPQLKEDLKVVPRPDMREEFRGEYMEGCLLKAEMYEFCQCNYDYLCDKYGLEAMAAAGIDIKSEKSKAIIMDGVMHCIDFIE